MIVYAGILEINDPHHALEVYLRCTKLLEKAGINVPVDVWNNIAVLQERTKCLEEALEVLSCKIVEVDEYFINHSLGKSELTTAMSDTTNTLSQTNETVVNHEVSMTVSETLDKSNLSFSNSKYIIIQFNQGILLEKLGRIDEAIGIYSSLIQEHHSFVDPYLRLAWVNINTKGFQKAEELLKEASKIDSSNVLIWYHYAYLYEAMKASPSQERKMFERILSTINKHDLYSLLSIGNIYYKSARKAPSKKIHDSDLSKALDFYQKSLFLESHSCHAANGIAICLQQKGYIKEARDIFSQLKQNEIDFPDSWINLAHLHLDSHQYGTALNLYENCQHRFYQDNDPIVFMFMAKCLYCLGKEEGNFQYLDRAIVCLEQASELESTDPLFQYNLAMCQQDFAQLRLSLETSKRTVSEIEKASQHIDSAMKIFSDLVNEEHHASAGITKRKIYDPKVLKERLESCKSLKDYAASLLQRQIQEEQLKQEKIQQLKAMRMLHQEKEQTKLMEEASKRQEQERVVQQQRNALGEKLKQSEQERTLKPDEIDQLFEE